VNTSAPDARELINNERREVPRFGSYFKSPEKLDTQTAEHSGSPTFRISSRSSLKPSATDVIQNFLNFSFKICSCCASSSTEPPEGMNDGIVAAGRGGDGDRCLDNVFFWLGTPVCCAAKGWNDCWTEESELESESDSEDEDEDEEDSFAVFCAPSDLFGVGASSSEEDEESESEEDDEAARLFRFLIRFLAGALVDAGPMLVVVAVRFSLCMIVRGLLPDLASHLLLPKHFFEILSSLSTLFNMNNPVVGILGACKSIKCRLKRRSSKIFINLIDIPRF
jgi:hypothetical protein